MFLNQHVELLSFFHNCVEISCEDVYQIHFDSDQHKWSKELREAHFAQLLQSYRLNKWVHGEVELKHLCHVTMANTKWIKLLCGFSIQMPTLIDVVKNYSANKDNIEDHKDCAVDLQTLNQMVETYTITPIKEPFQFVVIEENTFLDGNHRIIALALTQKHDLKVRGYIARP